MSGLEKRGKVLRAELGDIGHDLTEAKARLGALRARKAELDGSEQTAAGFEQTFEHSVGIQGGATTTTMPTGSLRVLDDPESKRPRFQTLEGRLALPVAAISDVREGHREDGDGRRAGGAGRHGGAGGGGGTRGLLRSLTAPTGGS